ncbi:uncharacterized protein BXZ73DRAFT_83411 [Epithele typhae]|uniref:uncharacterized protein n=1 Tax=Epithele typhae TaxID=378194 RepID=UPI0020082C8B|nr:uncharacterized protein BXZ73DRAFT_83411 [Epithele typhae]KAH9910591.1 hypothetical protein BXZ73DRAFT_83411 [Epithele typhae]
MKVWLLVKVLALKVCALSCILNAATVTLATPSPPQDNGGHCFDVDPSATKPPLNHKLTVVIIEEPSLGLPPHGPPNQRWPVEYPLSKMAHYMEYNIRKVDFKAIKKHFPQHIFLPHHHPVESDVNADDEGEVSVIMWEWLLHQDTEFSLVFFRYGEFVRAVLGGDNSEVWRCLCTSDLVIGGIDFTDDYQQLSVLKGNLSKIKKYRNQMALLTKRTVVWPDPWETHLYGSKLALINHLDILAAKVTHTLRPVTKPVNILEPVQTEEVLKRGHSAWGNHVSLPSQEDSLTRWKKMVPNKALEKQWFPSVWFSQPFLQSLREIGEMRCFFFGKKLTHIVHTLTREEIGRFDYDKVRSTIPLKDIPAKLELRKRELMKSPKALSLAYAWIDPEDHEESHVGTGLNELQTFAEVTFKGLCQLEQGCSPTGSSDLTLFARIDIGLIPDNQGGFQYFVNEVERSWGTTLFGSLESHVVVSAVHQFGQSLAAWVKEKHIGAVEAHQVGLNRQGSLL